MSMLRPHKMSMSGKILTGLPRKVHNPATKAIMPRNTVKPFVLKPFRYLMRFIPSKIIPTQIRKVPSGTTLSGKSQIAPSTIRNNPQPMLSNLLTSFPLLSLNS